METIILNSCSKINIGLNVIRKREDGYHDLETIFYPVKLCDTISFKKASEFRFTCNNKELQNAPNNLILRAKDKVEELTGTHIKAEINLSKYIPLGGGLGGGSSNAAVTLKGLNMLYNFSLDDNTLSKAALELGSDVPFFLNSKPCLAYSRGEIMEYLDFKINKPILIVNPGVHVSTAWAFQNIIPKRPTVNLKDIIKKELEFNNYKGLVKNDFEEIVFEFYPVVFKLRDHLYKHGALFSQMSGSGSTVYGIYENIQDAINAQKSLNNNYLTFIHYE